MSGKLTMTTITKSGWTQTGNAVTEFIAMLAALVPMFLLVPVMGKIGDMNQATVQASRFAAWERTVAAEDQKSDGQLVGEMHRRFYSSLGAFIKTGQSADNQNASHRNPMWRDHSGARLLRNFDDVSAGIENSQTPGSGAGTVGQLMSTFLNAMGRFRGNSDNFLNNNGLYRADVSSNVAAISMAPFNHGTNCAGEQTDQTFLCIRRHNVILADSWSARDPEQVANRVKSLVPMSIFERFAVITDVLARAPDTLPMAQEFAGFRPGYVAPDVIPPDRLGPYQD
jgi:hypothetical protein